MLAMLAVFQGLNPQKLEQGEEICKIMNNCKTLQNYKLHSYTVELPVSSPQFTIFFAFNSLFQLSQNNLSIKFLPTKILLSLMFKATALQTICRDFTACVHCCFVSFSEQNPFRDPIWTSFANHICKQALPTFMLD